MTPWTFVHVTDMQPGSPRSYRYNPSWIENWHTARQQIEEIQPDFLLVGGDLTRDGNLHRFELEEMRAELAALAFPVHVIAGNMDTGNKVTHVIGRQRGADQCTDIELNVNSAVLQQFVSVCGPLWWSFEHKGVRFSGFTDMVVNSGLPEEAEFWQWAAAQRQLAPARHHVWMMHYPPFVEQPDEPSWDLTDPAHYNDWYFSVDQPGRQRLMELFAHTGATLVLSGHVHCHRVREVAGVRYIIGPAPSFAQWANRWPDGDATLGFLRCDVGDSGIKVTRIPLRSTHDLPGYGPGGHPAPHVRDYSLAWEKD